MKKIKLFFIAIIFFTITSQSIHSQSMETISDSLYSNILNEQREFWVQLPENYSPNDSLKYPVLYLLDGMSLKNNLETVYGNYWGHYLPHMILVGISNQEYRTRDLTISKVETRRGGSMNDETG